MKPEITAHNARGFTLVEITIVVALTSLLLVVIIPLALQFFKTQNVTDTTSTLVSSLREAHTKALFQKNDSSFGIKFLAGSYVIFQGSSYASRTQGEDTVVAIPTNTTVSGISEIVFAKRTGISNTTGVILVQSGSKSLSISITTQGIIEMI